MFHDNVGFIGAGRMASALASGWQQAKLVDGGQIHASDPSVEVCQKFTDLVQGAQVQHSNSGVVDVCDLIVLAVKPQHLNSVLDELQNVDTSDKLFVSIVAGVTLSLLCERLGTKRVVRVMPNTPCLIGQAAAAYCHGESVTAEDRQQVAELLGAVGLAIELTETHMDAVTGLSGSGPAFVYLVIEALSDAGVGLGLPRDVALRLAAQTVRGAAEMVTSSGEHPAVLKDQVTSPGGTTIAGIEALEAGGLRTTLISAVQAAAQRSAELGG